MNQHSFSGTQLSLINEARLSAPDNSVSNARMAFNVLQRLQENSGQISSQAAVYFKAIFPSVVAATESAHGLPITKTRLRPQLLTPMAAIMHKPPVRAEELAQLERLLDFVQRRLATPRDVVQVSEQVELLLGSASPELLVTPDGMPSQLYAADRQEAMELFHPVFTNESADTAEALVETYVLLRSNHADVQSGIADLFWSHSTGFGSVPHQVEGCGDGQTRAYFKGLLAKSEERRHAIFSTVNWETFYTAMGEQP
jgi:hypothetical protein